VAGYRAKKRLGQNFLKSKPLIEKIIEIVDSSENDLIIEVGAGRGALTLPMAESGAKVIAIELDRDLIGYLTALLRDFQNVKIINEDFLLFDSENETKADFILVGNLPYNITSPVIDWMVRYHNRIKKAVLMVQKELAERLSAQPGSKHWSPLSIFSQLCFEIKHCFNVKAEHFRPRPKVESAVVQFEPKDISSISNPDKFDKLVRASFQYRRKLLVNNIAEPLGINPDDIRKAFATVGLDANCRAEEISTEKFLKLTEHLTYCNLI